MSAMTSQRASPYAPMIRRLSSSSSANFLLRSETPVVMEKRKEEEEESTFSETAPLITKTRAASDTESQIGSDKYIDKYIPSVRKTDRVKQYMGQVKVVVLFILSILICTYIAFAEETEESWHQMIVDNETSYNNTFKHLAHGYPAIRLTLQGPLSKCESGANITNATYVTVHVDDEVQWTLLINTTKLERGSKDSFIHTLECEESKAHSCLLRVEADCEEPVAVLYHAQPVPATFNMSVLYAALVLAAVYVLISFELVHRTLAGILGSLAAVAVLSALNQRPTMETIMTWVDMETISLLFGMMVIVAIFSDTGVFDYSALLMYKMAKGKVLVLVSLLCLFSAVVSAFLDNVTTILLLAPVTIRLCEVLNIEPKRVLIAEVLFSNIGGTGTAIGDPPNVIIVAATSDKGITFAIFTGHAIIGIILVTAVSYGLLWLYYKRITSLENVESIHVVEMRREVELWRRAASRVLAVTREESLMKALFLQKAVAMENKLNRTIHKQRRTSEKDFRDTLEDLTSKYKLTDRVLLMKSSAILAVVVFLLFCHSFISSMHLGLGWVAVMGAIWLLVLADTNDLDSILHKVEWSTLIFFASLFTLMEALAELGLIDWIGQRITELIVNVSEEHRMLAALCIVLWISALASSFIDNIPYTTAMVPVLVKLSQDPQVNLPLLPLIMALSFGACLGGNGTLIGASANVVCAGIAEQHGYNISFKDFFLMGFPLMLITTAVGMVYLIIFHVGIGWNA